MDGTRLDSDDNKRSPALSNGAFVSSTSTGDTSKFQDSGSSGSSDHTGLFPREVRDMLRLHWHATLTYCGVFWNFGMCVAFLGPTLLDLGCLTSSDQQTMSWVFFVQLLATLLGAMAVGYLVQRCIIIVSIEECNGNYILLASTIALPMTLFLVPFCTDLKVLGVVLSIMGLNMGCIDCLANLQMMHIYGSVVPPFLQALHFCYGLGAFVSPMIAEPFLLNEDCSVFLDEEADNITVVTNSSIISAVTLEEAQALTEVKYAFWIMAAMQIPVAILVFSLAMKLRLRGWRPDHRPLVNSEVNIASLCKTDVDKSDYSNIDKEFRDSKPTRVTQVETSTFMTTWFLIIGVTASASAIGFIFDGLQSSYGGYIYSYAVKSVADLGKTEGAYLNATFWGMFALGRLFSIFVATRLSPSFMLLCNILGCSASMILMMVLRHNHISLYVGTVLFGLFLSSATPTALSLAEHYIDFSEGGSSAGVMAQNNYLGRAVFEKDALDVEDTSPPGISFCACRCGTRWCTANIFCFPRRIPSPASVTTCIVVVAAIGEMICPVVVGNLFASEGPFSLLVFGNAMCWLAVMVYLCLWFVGRKSPKERAKSSASFLWFRACCIKRDPADQEDELVVKKPAKYYTQTSEDSSNYEMDNVQRPRSTEGARPSSNHVR